MTPCSSGNSPTMPVTRSALASPLRARSAWSASAPLNDAFFDQPARQLRDALDLVGDGAQLLVEDDAAQASSPAPQAEPSGPAPRRSARRRAARRAPARCPRRSPRRRPSRRYWRRRRSAARACPSSSRITKYFWLMRMVSWITSSRHVEEVGVERAEQRHRPFGQPGILDHQPLILDEQAAGILSGLDRALADDRLALLLVDDDMAGAQLLDIVMRAADRDRPRVMEAMADASSRRTRRRRSATGTISSPSSATIAVQRPHPAQRCARLSTPRPSASTWARGSRGRWPPPPRPARRAVARPGFSIRANQTPSRSSSWSCVSPVLRRKPSSACGGADVRGPFNSSLTASVATGRPRAISASRRGVE